MFALYAIAVVIAYTVKGLTGFANTLVFSTIMSFSPVNIANITPIELVLGTPSNIFIAVRERKGFRWRVVVPLAGLMVAGCIPGALVLKFGNPALIKMLFGVGVALVGLIVAAVCDLCFTHALLGFCLGLVFLIAAAIMALCFDASARLQCDEDEPERQGDVDEFNHQLTATTVSVLSLIGCVLAFLLPLLLVEAYYGMATGSWLLLGLGCVAVALGVGHVVYTLWLRPALVRRGLLGQELLIRTQRDKGLLRRFLKVTLPATAVGIVLIIVLEASGAAWLAKAEKFDNYADFEKFMYDCAMEEAQSEWDGFTLIPLEEGYRVMDGSDPVTGDVTFQTDTVTDKDGRVLSTYASGGVSMVTFRFDKSDDGLPVQVYTHEAMRHGWALQDGLQAALVAAIYILWLVCSVVYFVRRKKG